jgi:hypothetical protein
MLQSLTEFLEEAKDEIGDLNDYNILENSLKSEYYELIEAHVKAGGTLTRKQFNQLDGMLQFHFNKHYNYRGDKVID